MAGNSISPAFAPVHAPDDGGLYLAQDRPNLDRRSKLQRSKEAATDGQVVNACLPHFGCQDHELDPQGYCKHVVGFTDPNDERIYLPMKERPDPKGGKSRYRFVDGGDPQLVRPGDVLVKERVASRVYRATDDDLAELERLTAPKTLTPAQ